MAACIATWSFGLQAVQTAARLLEEGADCVDATEAAVRGQCMVVVILSNLLFLDSRFTK